MSDIRRSATLALAALISGLGFSSAAFGCGFLWPCPYQADLNFSRAPGLGYWNGGLYSAGDLWIWDRRTGRLTAINQEVHLTPNAHEKPTTISSTNVTGISVSGTLPFGGGDWSPAAAIGHQVAFTLKGGVRQHYYGTYTALRDAYTVADEEEKSEWQVRNVTTSKSQMVYVLVNSIVSASSANITIGGKTGTGVATLSLKGPNNLSIDVSVDRGRQMDCSGTDSACFFGVQVMRGYIASGPDHPLMFQAIEYNGDDLSDAFRRSQ